MHIVFHYSIHHHLLHSVKDLTRVGGWEVAVTEHL